MQQFNQDECCWEEVDDYEPLDDSYKYVSYSYIVNPGSKVGTCFERYDLGFADEDDIKEIKEFVSILAEPLRKGLFEESIINEIFSVVKYV